MRILFATVVLALILPVIESDAFAKRKKKRKKPKDESYSKSVTTEDANVLSVYNILFSSPARLAGYQKNRGLLRIRKHTQKMETKLKDGTGDIDLDLDGTAIELQGAFSPPGAPVTIGLRFKDDGMDATLKATSGESSGEVSAELDHQLIGIGVGFRANNLRLGIQIDKHELDTSTSSDDFPARNDDDSFSADRFSVGFAHDANDWVFGIGLSQEIDEETDDGGRFQVSGVISLHVQRRLHVSRSVHLIINYNQNDSLDTDDDESEPNNADVIAAYETRLPSDARIFSYLAYLPKAARIEPNLGFEDGFWAKKLGSEMTFSATDKLHLGFLFAYVMAEAEDKTEGDRSETKLSGWELGLVGGMLL